jgi:putative ABC transport system permease protein
MLTNYLKLAFKVLLRRKFFTFVSRSGTSGTLLVLVIAWRCSTTPGADGPRGGLDHPA